MRDAAKGALNRRWVHSHEEDTDEEMVFRPQSYAFPPSRGRTGLDLHEDGSYAENAPGPTDRPTEAEGTWELDDGELKLRGTDGSVRVLTISSVDSDRLVVRKSP
jgi:hypothetical protein